MMNSFYSMKRLFRGCVITGSLMMAFYGCVDNSAMPPADKTAREETAQELLEKTVKSYHQSVCERKYDESKKHVCLKGEEEGKKSEIWRKAFPMGAVCVAYTLSGVRMDPSHKTAEVNSLIEQKVYPPTGSGTALHRRLNMRETWREFEGRWCIEDTGVIDVNLMTPGRQPPDEKEPGK